MSEEINETPVAEEPKRKGRATAKKEDVSCDDRVDVFIPRGQANDDPNFFVSVNGVNYILPRGKTSRVPFHVATEIHRSFAAQEALDKRVDEMLAASK